MPRSVVVSSTSEPFIMFNPTHLSLSRHNVYYLRFPLPPELHPRGHSTDIKVSLRTRCPQEALHLSRTLVYAASCFIKDKVFTSMDYQQIRTILTNHFKEVLNNRKAKVDTQGSISNSEVALEEARLHNLEQEIKLDRKVYPNTPWKFGTDEVIEELLAHLSLNIAKDAPEFEVFRIEYLKARRSTMQQALEHNKTYNTYQIGQPTITLATANPASSPAATTAKLADMYELYEGEKLQLKHWTTKTASSYRSQVSLLIEYLGNDALMDLTNKQATTIRTMLLQIPKQPRTKPKYKRMTISELMALKHGEGMSEKNINKYLQAYSGLYDWALTRGEVNNNFFKGLITRVKNKEPLRDEFSTEQIEAMKFVLLSKDAKYKEHHKWGALIGMYTGARLNEVAQLEILDIVTEEGELCFHFTNEVKSGDTSIKKGIKTYNSIRYIPIHPLLIKYGLLKYIEETKSTGANRLFPELSYDKNNGYGRNISRWFCEAFLVEQGIKTTKLNYHSLRHSVSASLIKADVPEPLVESIVGHAKKSVLQKNYAKGYTIAQKVVALSKLPY